MKSIITLIEHNQNQFTGYSGKWHWLVEVDGWMSRKKDISPNPTKETRDDIWRCQIKLWRTLSSIPPKILYTFNHYQYFILFHLLLNTKGYEQQFFGQIFIYRRHWRKKLIPMHHTPRCKEISFNNFW